MCHFTVCEIPEHLTQESLKESLTLRIKIHEPGLSLPNVESTDNLNKPFLPSAAFKTHLYEKANQNNDDSHLQRQQ